MAQALHILPRAAIHTTPPCWRWVLAVFLVTRLLVWAGAYTGAIERVRLHHGLTPPLKPHQLRSAAAQDAPPALRSDYDRWVRRGAPLMNWDAHWYADILEHGYQYTPPPPDASPQAAQNNIAFFPLLPLLAWPLKPLLGVNGALLLITHAAALAAALAGYAWARRHFDETGARLATAVLLCWPTACFYSFGYAESLMLMLLLIALWQLDRRQYAWAALACALATAARPTAICLAAIIPLVYLTRAARRRGWAAWGLAPWLGVVAAGGGLLYAAYLYVQFGSVGVYVANYKAGWLPTAGPETPLEWLGYLALEPAWRQFRLLARVVTDFPLGTRMLLYPLAWNMPLSLATLALSALAWRRTPAAFRPYLLLAPLIFLLRYASAGWSDFALESMARYTGVAAPSLMIVVALLRRPAARRWLVAALVALLGLQVAWAYHFGMGEWTG